MFWVICLGIYILCVFICMSLFKVLCEIEDSRPEPIMATLTFVPIINIFGALFAMGLVLYLICKNLFSKQDFLNKVFSYKEKE